MNPAWHSASRAMGWLLVLTIRAYQCGLRVLLVGACRYHPSCSEYAADAVRMHGPWRGGWLAVRRLSRCHPFAKGGYDPVPAVRTPGT
jgi:putative membrane protein insertion efficiency factor